MIWTPTGIAAALLVSVSVLVRRVRQVPADGGLTMPERTALSRLDRVGPDHVRGAGPGGADHRAGDGRDARRAARRAAWSSAAADPDDGRRVILTVTDAGRQVLQDKRNARTELLARALTGGTFTPAELEQLAAAAPLLERLAQSI